MYTYVLNMDNNMHNIIYEWTFMKWDVRVLIESNWLKIGTGVVHLR